LAAFVQATYKLFLFKPFWLLLRKQLSCIDSSHFGCFCASDGAVSIQAILAIIAQAFLAAAAKGFSCLRQAFLDGNDWRRHDWCSVQVGHEESE